MRNLFKRNLVALLSQSYTKFYEKFVKMLCHCV